MVLRFARNWFRHIIKMQSYYSHWDNDMWTLNKREQTFPLIQGLIHRPASSFRNSYITNIRFLHGFSIYQYLKAHFDPRHFATTLEKWIVAFVRFISAGSWMCRGNCGSKDCPIFVSLKNPRFCLTGRKRWWLFLLIQLTQNVRCFEFATVDQLHKDVNSQLTAMSLVLCFIPW